MDDNVIKFEPKQKVYKVFFTTPPKIRMTKGSDCDIALEVTKDPEDEIGYGTAWIPAVTKREAERKLLDLLNVNNITFEEE
mgnify:CR=1 FL=1